VHIDVRVVHERSLVSLVWVMKSLFGCGIGGQVDVHLGTLVLDVSGISKVMDNDILVIVNGVHELIVLVVLLSHSEVARGELGLTVAAIKAATDVLTVVKLMLGLVMFMALHWLKGVSSTEEALNLGIVVIVVDWMDHFRVVMLELSVVEFVGQTSNMLVGPASSHGHLFAFLEVESILFNIEVMNRSTNGSRALVEVLRVMVLGVMLTLDRLLDRSSFLLLVEILIDGSLQTKR